MKMNRRHMLMGIGDFGAGLLLSRCSNTNGSSLMENASFDHPKQEAGEKEVTAVEDLMREHGVLRRALFIYSESAIKLRENPFSVAPDALHRTATLFRTFGEDYHEKSLEEAYLFPVIKKAGGAAASYPEVLIAQHLRGREITGYILSVTQSATFRKDHADALADALDAFVRMYRPHAAREDTIIFPAWKNALSAQQLDDMNETFEDIEHRQFGEEGFENAVRQITVLEAEFGMADLSQFTAPAITG